MRPKPRMVMTTAVAAMRTHPVIQRDLWAASYDQWTSQSISSHLTLANFVRTSCTSLATPTAILWALCSDLWLAGQVRRQQACGRAVRARGRLAFARVRAAWTAAGARGGLVERAGSRCERCPAWKGDGRRPQPASCVWKVTGGQRPPAPPTHAMMADRARGCRRLVDGSVAFS